jgi:hypothetical protein
MGEQPGVLADTHFGGGGFWNESARVTPTVDSASVAAAIITASLRSFMNLTSLLG